ncbi:hypothetical protein TRAPUB_4598, partial [Trametes pubescens]
AMVVRAEVGVVALLVYEYIITLDQELGLFWRRKKTGATVLFLSNRYITLLCFAVLGAATFAPMSDHWQLAVGVTGANIPLFGCGAGLNGTPRQQFIRECMLLRGSQTPAFTQLSSTGSTVQCACNITADILVIIVTWWYSIKTHGLPALRAGGTRSYLADIMAINCEFAA